MQIANPANLTQQPGPSMFATGTPDVSTSGNPGTSTAAITANDFLQLLVTELKNQDPTANTDPNEYVNQLVQVNTLQQQIQMNQTLDGGPTLTGANSGILQQLEGINQTLSTGLESAEAAPEAQRAAPAVVPASIAARPDAAQPEKTGNLGVVSDAKAQASAQAVAHALAPHRGPAVPNAQRDAFQQFAARIRSSVGK